MRGADRLQKILYLIMGILGIYILYKGGSILLDTPAAQRILDSGTLQRGLEDSAMRTWAPGYTASMEEHGGDSWAAGWMQQAVPVYSYLAGGDGAAESESGEASVAGDQQEAADADGAAESESGKASIEDDSQEAAGENGASGNRIVENGNIGSTAAEGIVSGDGSAVQESGEDKPSGESEDTLQEEARQASSVAVSPILLEQLQDFDYLISNYYTVDGGTVADESLLDVDAMLGEDLTLQKNPDVPQILIYHTHSQESFADSREGKTEDTIVGMGEVLAEHLRNTYGYNVIHDTGVYDLVDGILDRSASYDYAREAVKSILQENPTIEVIIDLHRDGVEGQKFVTEIDGKPASMIMFFNGISRDSQDQPITYLKNPYTKQNLAFSLQLQLAAREKYPGFTRNIYLKAERFNLHLRPRSLLIEAGTQLNTVEEEQNAMEVLAELLDQVLSGRTNLSGSSSTGEN